MMELCTINDFGLLGWDLGVIKHYFLDTSFYLLVFSLNRSHWEGGGGSDSLNHACFCDQVNPILGAKLKGWKYYSEPFLFFMESEVITYVML